MKDKVAIVIGGTGVVGRAVVVALLNAHYHITAVARRTERLQTLTSSLSGSEGRLSIVCADATNEAEVNGFLTQTKRDRGRIDCLVYSAAIEPDPDVKLVDYSIEAWQATIHTYVTGFFLCFREVVPLMNSGGHIVAISSAVTRFQDGQLPSRIYVGHYAAAKAALDELCKWARREAAERGIFLSRIAPGAIDCPFHRNAPAHRKPAALLPAEDVAKRVVDAIQEQKEIDEYIVAQR